jgi:hypothetical protein
VGVQTFVGLETTQNTKTRRTPNFVNKFISCVESLLYILEAEVATFDTILYFRFTLNDSCWKYLYEAVTMKNGVLWDVRPCGSCNSRRNGRT